MGSKCGTAHIQVSDSRKRTENPSKKSAKKGQDAKRKKALKSSNQGDAEPQARPAHGQEIKQRSEHSEASTNRRKPADSIEVRVCNPPRKSAVSGTQPGRSRAHGGRWKNQVQPSATQRLGRREVEIGKSCRCSLPSYLGLGYYDPPLIARWQGTKDEFYALLRRMKDCHGHSYSVRRSCQRRLERELNQAQVYDLCLSRHPIRR